jgi:hypothetical protein
MTFKLRCPNGHKLRFDAKDAGKKGMCPKCHTRVTLQPPREVSDTSILAVLGDAPSDRSVLLQPTERVAAALVVRRGSRQRLNCAPTAALICRHPAAKTCDADASPISARRAHLPAWQALGRRHFDRCFAESSYSAAPSQRGGRLTVTFARRCAPTSG